MNMCIKYYDQYKTLIILALRPLLWAAAAHSLQAQKKLCENIYAGFADGRKYLRCGRERGGELLFFAGTGRNRRGTKSVYHADLYRGRATKFSQLINIDSCLLFSTLLFCETSHSSTSNRSYNSVNGQWNKHTFAHVRALKDPYHAKSSFGSF